MVRMRDQPREVREELDAQLAKIANDRLRVLVPLLLFAVTVALVISGPAGIPLGTPVFVVNAGVAIVLVITLVLLRANRVRGRHVHELAALVSILAPITTLATEAGTGVALAMVVMLEITASSLQISSRWMAVTTFAIIGAWLPFGIRDGGPRTGFDIALVLGAGVVAVVVQIMLRRALIRTELARIDERRLNEQLIHAQRMEAVGTLAAGLAHDMNNILAGITTSAELIAAESDDPQVLEDCARIVDEGERGAVLTRSLLAFSRRGQVRRERVKLDAIVDPLRVVLARTLPKTIQIEYLIDAERRVGSPLVKADVVQIGQALVNLCINGSDAMEGTGKLTIGYEDRELSEDEAAELGVSATEHWAVLWVTDTGNGMDEATRARIFEPFFTTKPIGKGTGLGLSMVYGTVKSHDGAIRVISKLGEGTTFELFLPIVGGEPTPRPFRPVAKPVASDRRVALVVDDEPLVQVATRRMLERLEFEVLVASDGDEALLEFSRRSADIGLVVLDMGMPRMGGAECFRKLREVSTVPVLIASGYALAAETQELLVMRPVGFLEKPFTAAQLASKVGELVAHDG